MVAVLCLALLTLCGDSDSLAATHHEVLHFDAREFNHIVVFQRMRLRANGLPVHDWLSPFNVRNEVALRPAGDNGNLYTWTAQRY